MKFLITAICLMVFTLSFAQQKQKLVDVINRKTKAVVLFSVPKTHWETLLDLNGTVGNYKDYKIVPSKRKKAG